MSEEKAKEEQAPVLAAYCTKCGKCYGENWGMHVCPECNGGVEILRQPPVASGERKGINLPL